MLGRQAAPPVAAPSAPGKATFPAALLTHEEAEDVIPLLLLAAGYVGYWTFLKKPPREAKADGEVYVLPEGVRGNQTNGRFVKIGVGLLVEHGDPALLPAGEEAAPPEGMAICRGSLSCVTSSSIT